MAGEQSAPLDLSRHRSIRIDLDGVDFALDDDTSFDGVIAAGDGCTGTTFSTSSGCRLKKQRHCDAIAMDPTGM